MMATLKKKNENQKATLGKLIRDTAQQQKKETKMRAKLESKNMAVLLDSNGQPLPLLSATALTKAAEEALKRKKRAKVEKVIEKRLEYTKETTTMSMSKLTIVCGVFSLPRRLLANYLSVVFNINNISINNNNDNSDARSNEFKESIAALEQCKEKNFCEVYGVSIQSHNSREHYEVLVEELNRNLEKKMLVNVQQSVRYLVEYFNVYKDTFFSVNADTFIVYFSILYSFILLFICQYNILSIITMLGTYSIYDG
jgi:hypothetical protein